MDYTALLKRAASIVWNNKFLWALGFLAALGGSSVSSSGGGGGNFSFPSGSSSSPTTSPSPGGDPDFGDFNEAELEAFLDEIARGGDPLASMPEAVAGILGIAFLLMCCFFVFFIVMWFIRQVAEAGMIQSVFNIEAGQQMSFGEAMSTGMDSLWRYVSINLLLKFLPNFIFAAIISGMALVTIGAAIGEGSDEAILGSIGLLFACLFPLLCLLIPYTWWVTLVYPFAQRGVTLHDLGMIDAIKHGWQTLKNNFVPIFLLGVLFFALSFVVGIALFFVVYLPILLVTFAPLFYSLIASETVGAGSAVVAGFGIFLLILVGSLVNAVLVAYRSTVFTLAYTEFMDMGKLSKPDVEAF